MFPIHVFDILATTKYQEILPVLLLLFNIRKILREILCWWKNFVILKDIESLKLIFLPFNIFHRRG